MDQERFEAIARLFAHTRSRRRAVGLLLGMGLLTPHSALLAGPGKGSGHRKCCGQGHLRVADQGMVMENATPAAGQIRAPASPDFAVTTAPVAAALNAAQISAFMILVAQPVPWASSAAPGRSGTSVRVQFRMQIPCAAGTMPRIPAPVWALGPSRAAIAVGKLSPPAVLEDVSKPSRHRPYLTGDGSTRAWRSRFRQALIDAPRASKGF